MRRLFFVLPILFASPSLAEVTHAFESRFGVVYSSNADQGRGGTQPLFMGRYTSTFTHQADNGLRFRFEIEVSAGNDEPLRPAERFIGRGVIGVSSD